MSKGYGLLLVLVAALVSACAPSSAPPTETFPPTATPQTTPTEAPTAAPTATPTPIPLSELKLDSLLVQIGDLSAGLTGAQIRSTVPEMFRSVPRADNTIFHQFARGGEPAGGVAVFLYESKAKIQDAYDEIVSGLGSDSKPISEIGEKAKVVTSSLLIEFADLAFFRCNAVVHIRFAGTSNVEEIASYAKRLDTRLSEVICR